jgi:hypothetical protein
MWNRMNRLSVKGKSGFKGVDTGSSALAFLSKVITTVYHPMMLFCTSGL